MPDDEPPEKKSKKPYLSLKKLARQRDRWQKDRKGKERDK